MDKQAYQTVVGSIIDHGMYKKADNNTSNNWDAVWGAIKQHFIDNKDRYLKAGLVAVPLALGVGAGSGSAGKGLLAGLVGGGLVWTGSKYWPELKKLWGTDASTETKNPGTPVA